MNNRDPAKNYTEEELQEKVAAAVAVSARLVENLRNQIVTYVTAASVYKTVKQNKFIVLRQMLKTHFNTDTQPMVQPVEQGTVKQETDPTQVAAMAIHWISYHCPDQLTDCDLNSRFCWATLHGGIAFPWVVAESSIVDHTFEIG